MLSNALIFYLSTACRATACGWLNTTTRVMMVHFDHSNLCNDWWFEHQRPIQHAGLIILTCATMMVDKEHHNLCNDVCCSSTMNLCNDTCWSTTNRVTMVRWFDHSKLPFNDCGLSIKTHGTCFFDHPTGATMMVGYSTMTCV